MSVEGGPSPAEQHLGDRLAALVDGELSHDHRDRVLAHLVTCCRCKAEADAQRQLKSALSVAPPPPSDGLLARLQGLPGLDDELLDRGPFGGGGGFPVAEPPASGTGFRIHEIPRGSGGRGRRLAFAAVGGAAFAAFALGGAVIGSPSPSPVGDPGPSAGEERYVAPASARLGSASQLMYPSTATFRPTGVLAPDPSPGPRRTALN
ncbi:hypothetical protein SRB5_68440 [Streptomyces sp. RB5]|uniref:Putative zinc-finger domain-containing protein n=1 Tax=Streptomyces smaragdinus TaxID=2585196 RepID=A0A7K0CUI6_9ACTN|nr:hypothetical protein [Streptomyces smaragdinus]